MAPIAEIRPRADDRTQRASRKSPLPSLPALESRPALWLIFKPCGGLVPARILVVDDYPVVRKTIRDLLHSHSLDVCGEAEDGQEAVERVQQLQPNLVLLDINMPKMNGIQAAFEIRQLSPATKILFLSVQECSAEALTAIRVLGAAGFVAKSEAGKDLIPTLKRLFPDGKAMPESQPILLAILRRAPRYYFGGAVELMEVESGRMLVACVRALSLYGCFVQTDKSFRAGARVMLKITDSGSQFSAMGRIAKQANDGMGIEFTEIGPTDRSRLEDCLAELAGKPDVSGTPGPH
jgi:two-component system, chemotaxis family, chemotaxis protein CheY